jgi:hypothetical protein
MTPIIGIMASSFRSAVGPDGAFDALSTVTLSATTASITFAGIPNNYKHLQIRFMARTDMSSGGSWSPIGMRYNSDSSANYALHDLFGTGSATFASGYTGQTNAIAGYGAPTTNAANSFGVGVVDILDYQSISKNKTSRSITGVDNNGSGIVLMQSSLWLSTPAITSISFNLLGGSNGSNFLSGTQFSLYGVK